MNNEHVNNHFTIIIIFLLCESLLSSGSIFLQSAFLPLRLVLLQEPVGDVRRVVHAQPDAHDQQHRRRRVHRQAPEVHEPHHVDQREDDAEEDEDGPGDVGEHEDDDEEDADEGKDDAPVKLHRKDPVNLPELVSGEEKLFFSSD